MNHILKILLITSLLISALFSAEIHWLHDYNEALKQSKLQHKNIYIFIGADKCRFCDLFKKEALSKESVIQRLNDEYISVYLSRDQHQIPSKFATRGVPRHYFVDSNGTVYHEDRGSREESGFHSILDEAELQKD